MGSSVVFSASKLRTEWEIMGCSPTTIGIYWGTYWENIWCNNPVSEKRSVAIAVDIFVLSGFHNQIFGPQWDKILEHL